MKDKVIARQLFMSCEKTVNRLEYVILNDRYHVHTFIAKDDDTAQIYFKGFIDGMKIQREEILRLKKIANEMKEVL